MRLAIMSRYRNAAALQYTSEMMNEVNSAVRVARETLYENDAYLAGACAANAGYVELKTAPTLKSILMKQRRSTHNKAEGFVPANTAVEGLIAPSKPVGLMEKGTIRQANCESVWFLGQAGIAEIQGRAARQIQWNNDETSIA
jgi:hypothetical protein